MDAFTLSHNDLLGQWTVIYFYPKDSTPGCTTEGLEFQSLLKTYKKLNVQIWGVSRDSLKAHNKFSCAQGFEFPLLSDGDETFCKIFDVIKEKNMYGKKVLGIERSTFIVSPEGTVTREYRAVKAAGHAAQVLEDFKNEPT